METGPAEKWEAMLNAITAGGVVHDINNLLTGIIGNTEVALGKIDVDSPARYNLDAVLHASESAVKLVRQLLGSGRSQPLKMTLSDVNRIVGRAVDLLSCMVGRDIDILMNLYKSPLMVECDPVLIEQVIMNIAVNARDVMPGGGKLIITTSIADLPGCRAPGGAGGAAQKYVLLSIADTGKGIREEIRDRIFDPFFTTKGPGGNTGLGLAIVRSIIMQHSGSINVHSELDSGTAFEIYLPEAGPDG